MSNAISSITLCSVPIRPTHQIDFDSKESQFSYFSSKAKHTFDKCKYQARTASLRVKGYVDTLQNCNYGYYTNTYNGTSKTFYFWIVAKNFLSRETTELTIQIDVFQTWQFDFNFAPCMIEREHVDVDGYGWYTIPEDFELGDYMTILRKEVDFLTQNPCFILAHTDNGGGIFGKTYNGCHMSYYPFNDTAKLSTDIQAMADAGKGDAIAYIYQFPSGLLNFDPPLNSGDSIAELIGECTKTVTFNSSEQLDHFAYNGDTYKPYNNKLYCYPYMFITLKNPSGGNVVLKIENFADQTNITFEVQAVLTQHPTITLTPWNYQNKVRAYDDSIMLDEYGLCSWNNDNFANWFAQHRNSINAQSENATASYKANANVNGNNFDNRNDNNITQAEKGAINTTLGTVGALGGGNVLGGATTAIGGVANTYLDYMQGSRNAQNDLANSSLMNTTNYQNSIKSIMASVQDASVQPNTCKGSTSGSGLDVARNSATFYIEQTGIKPEYARMIDMYFQMFGYKINKVKFPNFKTRERWNYLKCVNSTVYGDIPMEDINAIESMFNNGITIWHEESYMYFYDTANAERSV